MRGGKRAFGARRNPITGLVKRHADHKNSREVMWGLTDTVYRACPVGRGARWDREGQEKEWARRQQVCSFVNPLKPPYPRRVHPNLSLQWKTASPRYTVIRFPSRESDGTTPPPPLFTSPFSALTFLSLSLGGSFSSPPLLPSYHSFPRH